MQGSQHETKVQGADDEKQNTGRLDALQQNLKQSYAMEQENDKFE